MNQINMYCKKCKKKLGLSVMLSGEADTIVMTNVITKCRYDKRVMILKKYTESMIRKQMTSDGKVYI